jgi:hypothetical protein
LCVPLGAPIPGKAQSGAGAAAAEMAKHAATASKRRQAETGREAETRRRGAGSADGEPALLS